MGEDAKKDELRDTNLNTDIKKRNRWKRKDSDTLKKKQSNPAGRIATRRMKKMG